MKNLTKTQRALALLQKEDQITIALNHLRKTHEDAMKDVISLTRLKIIEDIDSTLELFKK
tara:strand:+ start:188 stop:367 length:180 start_codon:yes stop_codon:yes gene_type:complete